MNELTQAWRAAGEGGDAVAAKACLAPDVELISPLTAQFRFRGTDQVGDVLIAAFEVISEIRFHTDLGDDHTRALFYRARAGGHELEEAQLLRLDGVGRIREVTLFGRPLPALTAVMAGIGPRILRLQNRPGMARLVAVSSAPLTIMTRVGDRQLVPLANPARAKP